MVFYQFDILAGIGFSYSSKESKVDLKKSIFELFLFELKNFKSPSYLLHDYMTTFLTSSNDVTTFWVSLWQKGFVMWLDTIE